MKKSYFFVIFILFFSLLVGFNKKQVNKDNSKQTIIEQNQKELEYNLYRNSRYGFSIEYPNTLKIRKEPTNRDGITLSAVENNVELIVFGSNNMSKETAESTFKLVIEEHPDASYKRLQENWFVASWIQGDKIVYYKSVVGEGSKNIFIFKYPLSQKVYYDSIVARISSSFKTPGIDSSH